VLLFVQRIGGKNGKNIRIGKNAAEDKLLKKLGKVNKSQRYVQEATFLNEDCSNCTSEATL
jgi:hypothetical protein